MSSQRIPDAVQSGSDGSQDRPNKRQRGQVSALKSHFVCPVRTVLGD